MDEQENAGGSLLCFLLHLPFYPFLTPLIYPLPSVLSRLPTLPFPSSTSVNLFPTTCPSLSFVSITELTLTSYHFPPTAIQL